MKQATLCFLLKGNKVCLAMKKRGFGMGKWNGSGGKLQIINGVEESVEQGMKRELMEELNIQVKNLVNMGTITFQFPQNPGWGQIVYVFITRKWEGEPGESEEMKPKWFAVDELPYEQMWDDDKFWLPGVLAGKKVKGNFIFNDQGKVVEHHLEWEKSNSD